MLVLKQIKTNKNKQHLVLFGTKATLVEGGHNGEKNFIDFFHVSDHVEQFGRYSIFSKKNGKMNYLDGWGVNN